MSDTTKAIVDAALARIEAAIARGERPNIADQLILGTNFEAIEGWFKDAYITK